MRKLKTLLVLSGLAVSLLTGCKTQSNTSKSNSTPDSTTTSSEVVKALESIKIAAEPTKKNYFVGDQFDAAGLAVKAVYNTGEEDLAATAYVLSGFDSATPGEKTITVTYEGKTATFKVNVIAVVAESIAIASEPTKKEYFVGDQFDPTGLTVKATFNNGSEATLAAADYTLSGFDSANAGEQTITVTYAGKTATFKVTVQAIVLASIRIAAAPTKASYYQDEEFDAAGLQVKAVMNNGSEQDLAADAYVISGFDSSKGGVNTVTVTYQEKTATFDLTIIGKDGIEITAPDKVRYGVGDEFDATGLTVKQKFADGTKKDLAADAYVVSGFDSASEGEKTVVITVGTQTAEFKVNVYKGAWNETETALMDAKLLYNLPFYVGLEFAEESKASNVDQTKGMKWYAARSQYVAEENDIEEYANAIEAIQTAAGERAWKDYETQVGSMSADVSILGFHPDYNCYQYTRYYDDSDRYYAYQIITVGIDLEGKLLVATTRCDVPYASDLDGIYFSYVTGIVDGSREFNDFVGGYYSSVVEESFRYVSGAPKSAKFFDSLYWPTLEKCTVTNNAVSAPGSMVCVYNVALGYPYYMGSKYSDFFHYEFEIVFTNQKLASNKQYTAADVSAIVAQYDSSLVTKEENGSYTVNTVINGNVIKVNYSFDAGYITVDLDVLEYDPSQDTGEKYTAEQVANDFNKNLQAAAPSLAMTQDSQGTWALHVTLGESTDESEANLKEGCETIASFLPDYMELGVSMYEDPTKPNYVDLFGDQSIFYVMIYSTPDEAIDAQIISYIYNGKLHVEIALFA